MGPYFPIDLGAGLTQDPPPTNISKLIKDVCFRFACFSCLIEKVAVLAFLIKKKKALSLQLIQEVGVGGLHTSAHM